MKANNKSRSKDQRECLLCHKFFSPNPKVKDQNVCSNYDCQRLRQKLNNLDWLKKNPVDYKLWYQDYGKAYRKRHPDYQRQYRQKKKKRSVRNNVRHTVTSEIMMPLLKAYQVKKKEALNSELTDTRTTTLTEKKELLTHCFILLKAKELSVFPLFTEKKELLTFCFNTS